MADLPTPHVLSCPMCGAVILAGATSCTVCGEPLPGIVEPREIAPRPAQPRDIAFAVVLALVALVITLPPNLVLTVDVVRSHPETGTVGILTAVWNAMVWGEPALVVGYWWYLGTKRGDLNKTYLWRIYWKAQAATLGVLFALGILLMTLCAVAVMSS
ncbi:MAG: hypothetical protein SH850_27105 [Planctomycetaceae bacterium]|nr:hypothetical protein [Planctomycetaceae bacterium]